MKTAKVYPSKSFHVYGIFTGLKLVIRCFIAINSDAFKHEFMACLCTTCQCNDFTITGICVASTHDHGGIYMYVCIYIYIYIYIYIDLFILA